ncbi:radical SAM protein [Thalassovita aquimarina]|uniref:radical SAM protein n=1 Tax=Thalassovita aquimarina TaxID=2785917 RepID=UPI001FE944AE|nr:radical SAM protein [Thalassovita aquimarina]
MRIALINPRFEPNFWGFEHALPFLPGRRACYTVTAALPALAALSPDFCDVTLIDENVEDIPFDRLGDFDVIGVTGMIVQQTRMHQILHRLCGMGPLIVAGGPLVSVAADDFEGLCDVIFVGEAETTWPGFLHDVYNGRPVLPRYEQGEKTDMTTVPAPRYDLLKAARYVVAPLQFSRGCPFLCEFCDIITIFGRRPRTKAPAQVLAELDGIRRAGFRQCFLVDDNFIGNKAKAREVLIEIVEWQKANGFPIALSTEASLNLADEAELLELMVAANFRQVFIGIETPRAASLIETRKLQNVRGDTMDDKLQRIRDAGLVVTAGFIVGFDNDDAEIFDEQFRFIQRNGIAKSLVAVLSAIPSTPLHDRLKAAGRLDSSHPRINFHPLQMDQDQLLEGYDDLVMRLFDPDAYWQRLLDGYAGSPEYRRKRAAFARDNLPRQTAAAVLAGTLAALGSASRLAAHILTQERGARVLRSYLRHYRKNRGLGRDAIPLTAFVNLCTEHWHFYQMARYDRKMSFGSIQSRVDRPDLALAEHRLD